MTSTTSPIEQLAEQSYNHAVNVLKGRFPEGESLILLSAKWSYGYSRDVLKAPWPEAEAVILTNPNWSVYYAINVLKAPWPVAEEIINSDEICAKAYKAFLAPLEPKKPTIEEYMAKIKVLEDKLAEITKLLN